jgi:hypothetical protein
MIVLRINSKKESLKLNSDDDKNYNFNKGMLWGTAICLAS